MLRAHSQNIIQDALRIPQVFLVHSLCFLKGSLYGFFKDFLGVLWGISRIPEGFLKDALRTLQLFLNDSLKITLKIPRGFLKDSLKLP